VDNVSKSFGKNIAVDRITFAMFERQIFWYLQNNILISHFNQFCLVFWDIMELEKQQ